ncbi:MAG: TRAP transporter fused permease subunit [Pseudolabrys sp.]|nr:TRAP transporter fused permease subunit [Pseudolabrys sp.]
MNERASIEESADREPATFARTVLATDVLQGALILCVVAWVLDLPRRFFGLAFYTEQLLSICLGLGLALSYLGSGSRKPTGFDPAGVLAAAGLIGYIIWQYASFGQISVALFICLGPALAWAAVGGRPWAMRWIDLAAAIISLALCAYLAWRYEALTYEIALLPSDGIIGSAILLLLVLEATRRSSGGVLVAIILVLAIYVFVGPHLPGSFATRPVSPARLITYLGLDTNGMIGVILSVAVLIVIPFTLLGQVLGRTGGSTYFADLAMSAMGRFRGGAAKIAVFGSALFGMISGAAVSNVMAVGIVTIPLMARSGFTPTRAAAIESVGSTGGQLMPPVMGAAAFIMAEFLQVSYGSVCIAATIPAILYYAALFMHVDLEAAKRRIGAAQVAEVPRFLDVLRSGWHFPIPIAFLIITIAYPEIFQIPIERSAIYATFILIVLSMTFGYRGHRVSPRQMLRAVLDTGRASLDILLIGAAAGLVVGSLNVSGISFGLTLQLIALSGGSLFVLLLLTAVISIILGMGMPTVSVYVLTASLLAPAIIKLGVTPMAAHMYVMYFGMLSMITPPVAIAAYAAANIARVSGWSTGWTAVVVGWSTFFIPFLFVTEPTLLMSGTWDAIVWDVARNMLGIFIGTAAVVGYGFGPLPLPMRLLFGAAALAILIPPHAFTGAEALAWLGLAGAIALLSANYLQTRNDKRSAATQVAGS